jgi:hypothetical protein
MLLPRSGPQRSEDTRSGSRAQRGLDRGEPESAVQQLVIRSHPAGSSQRLCWWQFDWSAIAAGSTPTWAQMAGPCPGEHSLSWPELSPSGGGLDRSAL